MRRVLGIVLAALVLAPAAGASQLIDRNAQNVYLEVNREGFALLTYRKGTEAHHVLAWGAVNAIAPSPGQRQVAFKVDYSGGWGSFRKTVWKTFVNACTPVQVPLAWLVAACQTPDGSYWALQSWQRALPDYGVPPNPTQAAWELRLSHWTGAAPTLTVRFGWSYRRFQQIYGVFSYAGTPVYGFRATPNGQPLDTFGRNVYVDTFNSAYGAGWFRENSFLTHTGTGGFCYGFYPHAPHPSGAGERYRATVIGPGVTPDAYWESAAPPPQYDHNADLAANQDMATLLAGDKLCRPN